MMSRRSMKYWRCSSASGVKVSLAKTEHRKSSIPGSRSKNRNVLDMRKHDCRCFINCICKKNIAADQLRC